MDVVADQDVSLHEVTFILSVFSDHREGVEHCGAQDADQRLDPGVGVHIGQVRFHDVTGCQSGQMRHGSEQKHLKLAPLKAHVHVTSFMGQQHMNKQHRSPVDHQPFTGQ